jgi:hypothetical protein
MKKFLLPVFAVALTACQTNLVQSQDEQTRKLAVEIASQIHKHCATYEFDLATGERKTGNVNVAKEPIIKSIKQSTTPSPWLRAETNANGKWINFHFNTETRKVFCSSKKWSEDPILSAIQF